MTYPEAIDYLFGIRLFGQKLGLATMRELARRLGHPERELKFIHIAGTNGKGSVAAMCHAVLQTAGYRTGLYTSPHLVSFCERFQINGQPISEADVVRLVTMIRPLLADFPDRPPTFFEVVTAMALQYFREQRVEVVVWETGLGGRLDATNIVTPLVAVITNIGFDHMQYLGNTEKEIAGEKAGIIKPGIPVVTAAEGEALEVIRRAAGHLTMVTADKSFSPPLLGRHQIINTATAVAALRASGLNITDDQIRLGLSRTRWPGRYQVVTGQPVVVLDGAHNAPAAEQLAATLREQFPGKPLALVLGVLRDKEYGAVCRILAPLFTRICCTRVNSERTSDPGELAGICRAANPQADVGEFTDVLEAYRAAIGQEVVVITGSLFLVGEAMTKLGLGTPATVRELVLQ
ncbi:MAG: Folylpolyglutamate synthase [Verrucomicrobiae bacterium]|nr:Folylpolyglutamate synthase [Verrucomicrobiae bacterium]